MSQLKIPTKSNNMRMIYGILSIALTIAILGIISTLMQHDTSASSAKGFKPGNIMSDAVMSNKNTMTRAQIQTFLKSKVTSCTSKGPYSNGSYYIDKLRKTRNGTRAETLDGKYWWYIKNGHFVCMAEASFNGQSAADIIYEAAQEYGINPQVIIVLLEKEQSLITDAFPNNQQYNTATGFACPDNAACDTKYYGLKNQIIQAAKLFREVLDGGWSNYPVGKNYIQYNPNPSCGGSEVVIENRATSALYRYTPYQPNQAALNAGYGAAPPCGAYGNRNFYLLFNDWFGSTQEQFKYKSENLVGESGVVKNPAVKVGEATEVVTIDKEIYTFYADDGGKSLRLSYWNGSKWTDTVADGQGSTLAGAHNADLKITRISAFEYNRGPQVFYFDHLSKNLRHIFKKNGKLHVETLDGSADSVTGRSRSVGSSVTSMPYNGGIQLFYFNEDSKNLEHTWWDTSKRKWYTETLDGSANSVLGKNRKLGSSVTSMPYNGGIQLFYFNEDSKNLEHTWWDTSKRKWYTETLDGSANSVLKKVREVGQPVSGVVYENNIQLFYHDKTSGEMVHTWWNSTKRSWLTERMDGDNDTVLGNYINAGKRIDTDIFNNRLFVTYYDDASIFAGDKKSSWRMAYWSGSSWIQHVIEGGGGVSLFNPSVSMPISSISMSAYDDKSLQVFYRGSQDQLRHFWVTK